jgi:hypothetical protein
VVAPVSVNDTSPPSRPSALRVLEPAEQAVVHDLFRHLRALGTDLAVEGSAALDEVLVRLEKIWEAIDVQASVLRGQSLGARHRDVVSLIETLSSCHPYSTEAFLPTRGVLVRAFLHAKLNFCRFLGLLISEVLADDPDAAALSSSIERIQTSAVCTIMAEDLLRVIASDLGLSPELRRRATWVLVQTWEDRACQVVPLFFPLLDSVWQAKSRVTVSYGTLSGISELVEILSEGCDPAFMECFSRDDVSDDQALALKEFVFNASYEQLQEVQRAMAEQGRSAVGAAGVASILKIPADQLHVRTCTCEEMIFTFRERQSMANHRRALDLPGPKRTAEEYLMISLLEQADDVERTVCAEK